MLFLMSITRIIPEFLEKFVIVCIFFVCVQSFFSSTDAVQTAPRQLEQPNRARSPRLISAWKFPGPSINKRSNKRRTVQKHAKTLFVCKNTVQPCWWFPHMCEDCLNSHENSPCFGMVINPTEGLCIPILGIPITGKMTIPNIRS